ncbi:uncharacterized protein TNCV_889851 [Trichonephila clavipes]|nr:uncharacterized protein TNCV_889851 [Trichonephila clavipes]
MAEYTNAEKADMILAYGATDCNVRAAQRLYAERHPVRRTPAHTMFARLHQQLCETGSFQKAARNRDRTARTELNEEIVLDMVETTPSLSTRGIANEIGISYNSVWRILDDSALHPFHYQRVQSLKECDFAPRQAFSQWYLQQRIANPFLQPPCCSQMRRLFRERDSFLVNVGAGILGDHLIGPYILPDRLIGPRYLISLEQVLPELLDSAHVTAVTRTSMWFQQDGAPAHFSISVRNHLDSTCGERWIGRGGPVHWPPRSSDLSCLDYFFWGQMKSLVYETPVNSAEELVARISAAAGEIRNTPEMLSNVQRSMKRRIESHAAGVSSNTSFDSSFSFFSLLFLL